MQLQIEWQDVIHIIIPIISENAQNYGAILSMNLALAGFPLTKDVSENMHVHF